ncbi:CaiB/BaiF CoA transferase family protein [Nocardia pseudovaccinii]|uniref:CaiB/BaiF CoA transferase family protein n=1 Tax=Nocardia pseudovaccinii TaxID=189540 RepID=UPI003D8A470B
MMGSSLGKDAAPAEGFLHGVRVLELADELGEYCGKVLAGLGADVVKVEPLGGEGTRAYGPFAGDQPSPNRSLYFWHYNFGKRSVVIDLDSEDGVQQFRQLAAGADVVIDTRKKDYLSSRGIGAAELREAKPDLVYARITPFGDDGPWADYHGSDLVHLALGGVMMNCGYDPEPSGEYDTPPIAPQMWQAYHIVGEVTAIQTIAALLYARRTGKGQDLSSNVHDAVSKNTETDLPDWVYQRQPHHRQTCRHSFANISATAISATKDGRWMLPYRTYLPGFVTPPESTLAVLQRYGMEMDLADPKFFDVDFLQRPENDLHVGAVLDRLIARFKFNKELWRDGQEFGLTWGPLRRPEENVEDEHWWVRGAFVDVHEPEIGRTVTEIGSKWYSPNVPWKTDRRAPRLGEHTEEMLAELAVAKASTGAAGGARETVTTELSRYGKPFALNNVRVVDLTWMLASAGAGRFFTALGADVIKVEHRSRPDAMRTGSGKVPYGGREERDAATEPLATKYDPSELDRSGTFMELNSGKRSISLNLKSDEGKALLKGMIKDADFVIEGYSPGTLDRMGLGYEVLKSIKPDIIYVQQSGMGQHGTYGRMRSFGPTAQAFSGLSEMSGFPSPMAPAGIGYSYLDWFGAYQMATAMMAALYRRNTTGEGSWIDSSQVDAGLYLTGTAVLDYTVNGRSWERYGNRSPYKAAAPSGAYQTCGTDRWIAISAFTEEQWHAVVRILGARDAASDPRFVGLADRLRNQDDLDRIVGELTLKWDGYELMYALQEAGVPAGVCQTAEDRCDFDPQLAHLEWQVEVEQRDIGTWPVREVPVKFSETPPYIGGYLDRSGPSFGQDTDDVLRDLLGLDAEAIASLRDRGAV